MITFITDDRGNRTHAIIPYEEWEMLRLQQQEPDELDHAAMAEILSLPASDRAVVKPSNPIKKARLRAKVTQADLAEAMGITQGLVSRMEREGHAPRKDTVDRVRKALAAIKR